MFPSILHEKTLGEEAKKNCQAGHLLERPFLKQLHQHCLYKTINTCVYNYIAIYETPIGKLQIVLCCCCVQFTLI